MEKILLCFILVCCVAACSKSAPKCSDNEARQLVLDLSKQIYYKKLFSNTGIIVPLSTAIRDSKDEVDNEIMASLVYGHLPKLEIMKKSKNQKVIELIDNFENETKKLKLESIRTQSKDDTIQKCTCEAALTLGQEKDLVKYSVQKTDDGKLHVEVNL